MTSTLFVVAVGAACTQVAEPSPTARPAVQDAASRARRAADYRDHFRRDYGRADAASFEAMTLGVLGFGEVVLGNRVTADLPPLAALRFVPGDRGHGVLVLDFADEGQARYPARAEDVAVAHRLVFGGSEDSPQLKPGAGAALIGLHSSVPYFELDDEGLVVEGAHFQVALHPAALDTDLGWSLLMSDVYFIVGTSLLDQLPSQGGESSPAARVRAALDEIAEVEHVGPWRLVDAPMHLSHEEGRLRVAAVAPGGAEPSPGAAFLELRLSTIDLEELHDLRAEAAGRLDDLLAAGEDPADYAETAIHAIARQHDVPAARIFFEIVPLLEAHSYDYHRINRFAALLAVVRWAAAQEVPFESPPKVPRDPATPAAVRLLPDGTLQPMPAYDVDELTAAELEKLESHPSMAVPLERLRELERELRAVETMVRLGVALTEGEAAVEALDDQLVLHLTGQDTAAPSDAVVRLSEAMARHQAEVFALADANELFAAWLELRPPDEWRQPRQP